jgi:hypothetical protein
MIGLLLLSVICLAGTAWVTRVLNGRAAKKLNQQLQALHNYHEVVILMPVCARPRYLQQVLAGLADAPGIENTLVIFSQDGSNPHVRRLIEQWKAGPSLVVQHVRPFLGLFCYFWDSDNAAGSNIYFLLNQAFLQTRAKGCVVLEEDILPARDFILYYQWIFRHVLISAGIMSVTAFNLNSRPSPIHGHDPLQHPYELVEDQDLGQPRFTGWSWGLTREMWKRLKKYWTFRNWDINLDRVMRQKGLKALKPVLARAKNIGMQGGINFTESDQNPKWQEIVINPQIPDYDHAPVLLGHEGCIVPYEDISETGIQNQREKNRKKRVMLIFLALVWILLEWQLFYS